MASSTGSSTQQQPPPRVVHTEIPTSITIVNEATPLIASRRNRRSRRLSLFQQPGRSSNNTEYRVTSLSTDPDVRKKEIMGMTLLGMSSLAFTLSSVFVRTCGRELPSLEIVFARSIMQLAFSLASCALLRINPLGSRPQSRKWILLRAVLGSLGLCLYFYSLTRLPLAETTGKVSLWRRKQRR